MSYVLSFVSRLSILSVKFQHFFLLLTDKFWFRFVWFNLLRFFWNCILFLCFIFSSVSVQFSIWFMTWFIFFFWLSVWWLVKMHNVADEMNLILYFFFARKSYFFFILFVIIFYSKAMIAISINLHSQLLVFFIFLWQQ